MLPTRQQIRALPNKVMLYKWYMSFPTPPPAVSYPGDIAFNHTCISSTLPKKDPTIVESVIRGIKTGEPGIPNLGDNSITLTFEANVNLLVPKFFTAWEDACSSHEELITQNNEDIKAVIMLTLVNNLNQPIRLYELFGCLPNTSEAGGDLGNDTAETLKPAYTLWFDDFKETYV